MDINFISPSVRAEFSKNNGDISSATGHKKIGIQKAAIAQLNFENDVGITFFFKFFILSSNNK